MEINPALSEIEQLAEWLLNASEEYASITGEVPDTIAIVEGSIVIGSWTGKRIGLEIIPPRMIEAWVAAVKDHLQSDDLEPGDDDEILNDLKPSDEHGMAGPA